MNKTFYRFALSFRGGGKEYDYATFAEAMFNDLSFPKEAKKYDAISRYIEEKADVELRSVVFDELFRLYEESV